MAVTRSESGGADAEAFAPSVCTVFVPCDDALVSRLGPWRGRAYVYGTILLVSLRAFRREEAMNARSSLLSFLMSAALACTLCSQVHAQTLNEIQKLVASDGAAYDGFGSSVSISGDYAIVGARSNDDNGNESGSAYVYYRNQGGPDAWGQLAKLLASDADTSDFFGISVSISGDYAVAGAYRDDDNGAHSGSAYVFYRNQGGTDAWGQAAKLTASDGAAGDLFGTVSISGDYAVAGASGDDDSGAGSGSAYAFRIATPNTAVSDVPNDQGGHVTVAWQAVPADTNTNTLTHYSIWRAAPLGSVAGLGKVTRTTRVGGSVYAWEQLESVDAHRLDYYSRTVPTFYDSCSATDGTHYFMVSAHTSDPNVFYDSFPNSGYSVDNLAPAPAQRPAASYAAGKVTVHWEPNGDADFREYVVYRDISPDIDAATAEPFAITSDTVLTDADLLRSAESYYVIYTQDIHDNLSPAQPVLVQLHYGDASGNADVTAYDASLILRHSVKLGFVADQYLVDVTGNGTVSALDASHVLRRVANPDHLYPVLGGEAPRPAGAMALTWVPDGAGWMLVVDDSAPVYSGELTLSLPVDAPVAAASGELVAGNQAGRTLRVAFARATSDDPVLFRLLCDVQLEEPPSVLRAQFNERVGVPTIRTLARPLAFALQQNAPNPFNPRTSIRFTTTQSAPARLAVYGTDGRLVRTLVDGSTKSGAHQVIWDGLDAVGRDVSSGVYLYRLTGVEGTIVRRMLLVR